MIEKLEDRRGQIRAGLREVMNTEFIFPPCNSGPEKEDFLETTILNL